MSRRTVRFEVAERFCDFMKDTKRMPETKAELRKLYLNVYRPLLDLPSGQCIKFASVLSCMKTSGFLKTEGEIIVYQVERNSKCKVEEGHEITNTELFAACNNQELPLQNAEKTSRKIRKLKGPKEKAEGNLRNQRYSSSSSCTYCRMYNTC